MKSENLKGFLSRKYPNWDITVALRYLPIANDIKRNFGEGTKILDVGSGEFGLATYISKGFDITGTDIVFGKAKGEGFKIVKASADKLPFKDRSFDIVVSVDMMEHLPLGIRKKAVSEMIRIAKDRVYLSFPRGRLSAIIDRIISMYYKLTHKKEMEFLTEHRLNGLPDEKEIKDYIFRGAKEHKKSIRVKEKGNTNSFLWLGLLLLGFSEVPILTNLYHKLLFFLPVLNIIHFWPTYRVVFRGDLND
ncbi:class I SAM-dependent methyltransferase [Patescibacteria group bacterium]|nr:class I SAM-dependent methyltransferase [Patescibacteria group bacterium]